MKLLLSGFEPFGGHTINPTQSLVQAMEDHSFTDISLELHTILLPVHYDECVELLLAEVERFQPDIIIACGLAAGRTAVNLERIAVNIKDIEASSYGDNRNERPQDVPIRANGPDGLFSTLPIRQITDRLIENGIPAVISNTAGTFICNNVMYGVLDYVKQSSPGVLAGFVHFPASTEMALHKPSLPTLPINLMSRALQLIIRTTVEQLQKDN